jgi:dihydroflavonol-4-reductase
MDETLVTGSTGLVGYHIVQSLLQRGRRVKGQVRSIDKGKALLPEACELVQGDITDPAAVRRAVQGCSVVYHAAGLPEQWLADPTQFQRVNVGGTKNAVDAALETGVHRFIYTSTIDILAAETGAELDESQLDPLPRATHYARSKQAADKEVVAAAQRGLPAIFLHPTAVYGPGPNSSPTANGVIAQLLFGRMPGLPPGGVSVVFAPDVGEGHVLAEEHAPIGSRYILSESYHPLPEFARMVLAESGSQKPLPSTIPTPVARGFAAFGEWMAQFMHRPPMLPKGALTWLLWQVRPSSEKARRELGWKPTPLREGLRETIAFLNRQSSGGDVARA